ncbi:TIGR04211 family SH3 domain-containing protein [Vibrio sp. PP-XX7]
MKKLMIMLLLSFLTAPLFARDYYVADKLFTYMHSGPNNQYRIIGSIDAGERYSCYNQTKTRVMVKLLIVVVDKDGFKTSLLPQLRVWPLAYLAWKKNLPMLKNNSLMLRRKAIRKKPDSLSLFDVRNKQISELEQTYSGISDKLTTAQSEIRELRAKLDTQKEDLLMKYFTYGGGVAFAGILLGIILPHIVPKRKKSSSNWL